MDSGKAGRRSNYTSALLEGNMNEICASQKPTGTIKKRGETNKKSSTNFIMAYKRTCSWAKKWSRIESMKLAHH